MITSPARCGKINTYVSDALPKINDNALLFDYA
jgi:hypothetical protein